MYVSPSLYVPIESLSFSLLSIILCIAQKFQKFDEWLWLAIHLSFPYKPLSLNVSPFQPMINLSKCCLSNFCTIRYLAIQGRFGLLSIGGG